MSVTTSAKKPAGPTLSEIERGLAQWGNLTAELEDLQRQREELKNIFESHEIVEQLPVLRAERDAAQSERDRARIEAQELRDQARADGEREKASLIAEGEQVKRSAEQEAGRLIRDAQRQGAQRADEVFAERLRILADREATVAARERDVSHALKPYREARGRMLQVLDGLEKIPTMIVKTGEA